MSAREAVLGAVRAALASRPPGSVDIDRSYRSTRAAPEILDLFVERVEDYRATVVRCTASAVTAELGRLLAGRTVVVPPGLPWQLSGQYVDDGATPAQLDAIDAVVTAAAVGVATTGTVVLDHRADQGRRALSLVPDLHLCVVLESQVVSSVPEAFERLDPCRPQTWISGPSATSDIELSRVEGVHGPRTLVVLLVSED